MTAADKPRADLVALLLQFEASAGSLASLHLTGPDAVPAVEAWVEMRGHAVQPETLNRRDLDGRTIEWVMWTVTPRRGPDWSVTCSLPDREPTAQADQQVLARVRAALNGEQPEAVGRSGYTDAELGRLLDAPPAGDEQPEAAKGSV